MDTYILTTADGAEHKIVSSDILTALIGWKQSYANTKYSVEDVLGIHNAEI